MSCLVKCLDNYSVHFREIFVQTFMLPRGYFLKIWAILRLLCSATRVILSEMLHRMGSDVHVPLTFTFGLQIMIIIINYGNQKSD